jgi:hypothetical protein
MFTRAIYASGNLSWGRVEQPGEFRGEVRGHPYKGTEYKTTLLRRSYREDGKVRNETVANLSHLAQCSGP